MTDFIPEAQTLLTFQQTVPFPKPLPIATYRAGFYPIPLPITFPRAISYIESLLIPNDSISPPSASDPSYTALTLANTPPKEPMGVLLPATK